MLKSTPPVPHVAGYPDWRCIKKREVGVKLISAYRKNEPDLLNILPQRIRYQSTLRESLKYLSLLLSLLLLFFCRKQIVCAFLPLRVNVCSCIACSIGFLVTQFSWRPFRVSQKTDMETFFVAACDKCKVKQFWFIGNAVCQTKCRQRKLGLKNLKKICLQETVF